MAEQLNCATLYERGESVVRVIQKVLAGKGSPEEEMFAFSLTPELVLAVATVQASLPQESFAASGEPPSEAFVALCSKSGDTGPKAVGQCDQCGHKCYTRGMIGRPCIGSDCRGGGRFVEIAA